MCLTVLFLVIQIQVCSDCFEYILKKTSKISSMDLFLYNYWKRIYTLIFQYWVSQKFFHLVYIQAYQFFNQSLTVFADARSLRKRPAGNTAQREKLLNTTRVNKQKQFSNDVTKTKWKSLHIALCIPTPSPMHSNVARIPFHRARLSSRCDLTHCYVTQ